MILQKKRNSKSSSLHFSYSLHDRNQLWIEMDQFVHSLNRYSNEASENLHTIHDNLFKERESQVCHIKPSIEDANYEKREFVYKRQSGLSDTHTHLDVQLLTLVCPNIHPLERIRESTSPPTKGNSRSVRQRFVSIIEAICRQFLDLFNVE